MRQSKNTLQRFTALAVASLLIGFANTCALAGEIDLPFSAANFTAPQDNLYLPMAIGATYVYMAETEDGVEINEITQTTNTINILDVNCTEVYDVAWLIVEGVGQVKTEETTDWMAWDNWGNAWYFGEDTTEFLYDDNWNLIGTNKVGSWKAGVDHAQPGILMLAQPEPGVSYRQEYYAGEAEDMAKVLKLNSKVSIEVGDFEECAETKEWTPLSPGVIEHKYYAPGVGLVFVEERKGKTVKVELVDVH